MRPFSWLFHHKHRVDQPFRRVEATGNFYQTASFYPMTFAVVSTVDEHGHTSIAPYSLAFPFDLIERPSVMLIARSSANTVQHLERTGRAALNFIEFDKDWLEAIVRLGYPGQTPDEKMAENPFELEPSPDAPPGSPQLLKDAFQVWECTLDGDFQYRPQRSTPSGTAERFMCLRIESILLRENFADMLETEDDFPNMAISYGFRHHTGERRFFFAEHKEPFAIPVPDDIGPPHQTIYYEANRIDPAVQFTEEAVMPLTSIPRPFLRMALKQIVRRAREEDVSVVDRPFIDKIDQERRGG